MEGNNNVGISQDGIEQFLDLIKIRVLAQFNHYMISKI